MRVLAQGLALVSRTTASAGCFQTWRPWTAYPILEAACNPNISVPQPGQAVSPSPCQPSHHQSNAYGHMSGCSCSACSSHQDKHADSRGTIASTSSWPPSRHAPWDVTPQSLHQRHHMATLCRDCHAWWHSAPELGIGCTSFHWRRPLQPLARLSSSSEAIPAVLNDEQFHHLADETLDKLQENFEAYLDAVDVEGSDVEYGQGVLTVRLGRHGTYVVNKQSPNRQIWMSSPVSGPVRYDWHEGTGWVYGRDGHEMLERVQQEVGAMVGTPIQLKPVA